MTTTAIILIGLALLVVIGGMTLVAMGQTKRHNQKNGLDYTSNERTTPTNSGLFGSAQ